jgi:hypothetical protein
VLGEQLAVNLAHGGELLARAPAKASWSSKARCRVLELVAKHALAVGGEFVPVGEVGAQITQKRVRRLHQPVLTPRRPPTQYAPPAGDTIRNEPNDDSIDSPPGTGIPTSLTRALTRTPDDPSRAARAPTRLLFGPTGPSAPSRWHIPLSSVRDVGDTH